MKKRTNRSTVAPKRYEPRYCVSVEYHALPDRDMDRWFERRAGQPSGGSGYLFMTGTRDLGWDYVRFQSALALWKRLRAALHAPNAVVRKRAPRARVDLVDVNTGLHWTAHQRWESQGAMRARRRRRRASMKRYFDRLRRRKSRKTAARSRR